jgi:hypothetical protein
MRDFVNAILLNVAAAIIFWLIFAVIPERRRRNKLRPKLELGIHQVYSRLFALFDTIMRFADRSPSSFQKKIMGKSLQPEDIELGLQNKCLNPTFLYDKSVNPSLLVIGKELFESWQKIDQTTERVFAFSTYLSTTEILLLEQIRGKLEVYGPDHFDRSAAVAVGNAQYMPVNPSLSYMTASLVDLYQLFCKLQTVVFDNKYEDRDLLLAKVQSWYEQGEYKKCKRLIRKGETKYRKDETWIKFYRFQCEYRSGKSALAYRTLENILNTNPDLVSSRGFLLDVMDDAAVRETIERHYSKAEVNRLDAVVRSEREAHDRFVNQANRLREYYRRKAT